MDIKEQLFKQLCEHIWFDVDSKDDFPDYKYNERQVTLAIKKWFEKYASKFSEKIQKESGETLYKTLKNVPLVSTLLFLKRRVTLDDIEAKVKEGLAPIGMYYPCDAGMEAKELIEWLRELCVEINKVREAGDFGTAEETTPVKASGPTIADLESLLSTFKYPSTREIEGQSKKIEELEKLTASLRVSASTSSEPVRVESDGTTPEGTLTYKKVGELFPEVTELTENVKNMEVPTFDWEGVHPDVPQVDEHYIFRPKYLSAVAYAFVTNQRMYAHGHTGSGKTTVIEQFAARIGFPFFRINCDSEMTRMDLIGRDKIKGDTSWFEDGILPRALSQPGIICLDEVDFTRPDVAYVMQSVNEGNGLRINEDAGRFVPQHEMCRMFATGNTTGQGDEHGMYQGARPQSMAFLDRYTVWMQVDYLDDSEREELIKRHYPDLKHDDLKALCAYTTEHIAAFTDAKVMQPLSPRGILAIAKATVILGSLKEALDLTVLSRASEDDRATLRGLIDRVA